MRSTTSTSTPRASGSRPPVYREIAIVGAGFAGIILARILHKAGRQVVLIERNKHPRFALGESSTPLAALSLERLARRYGLDDLADLAAYGRWIDRYPDVRRGLKRGFTFYGHQTGESYTNGETNESRLLVAASPDDQAADAHWLRADVDAHLLRQAIREGVELWERADLVGAEERDDGLLLTLQRGDRSLPLQTDFLIDAANMSGLLTPQTVDTPTIHRPRPAPATALLYSHFSGVRSFANVAEGAVTSDGPYPDDNAAVHHLMDRGWMYVLRFDHGITSAGMLLRDLSGEELMTPAADLWRAQLERYPTIQAQFAWADPEFDIQFVPRIQRRAPSATGHRWVSLPHSYFFHDPLYSTGIAWSLLAVERIAELVTERTPPSAVELGRYARLLHDEADQIETLVESAYLSLGDFDLFSTQSFLYFAIASFSELQQRFRGAEEAWHWRGFLGASDPVSRSIVDRGYQRLLSLAENRSQTVPEHARRSFRDTVLELIAPRNLLGLGDPWRSNLYPVDLKLLTERSHLLGMSQEEVEAALPRLRGATLGRA